MTDLQQFKHAWMNLSFDYERRFDNFIKEHDEIVEKIKAYAGDKEKIEKYVIRINNAARAYLASLSRCASTMITGPANFPAERQKKIHNATDKRRQYYYFLFDYENNLQEREKAETQEEKRERWIQEIEELKKKHEMMKQANTFIRQGKKECIETIGFSQEQMEKIEKFGGFTHQLSYNLAHIRRLEGQIARIDITRRHNDGMELSANGIRIEHDNEECRWNIFFPGKPSNEIRTLLKSNGFKWSPSRNAWTRFSKNFSQERIKWLFEKIIV